MENTKLQSNNYFEQIVEITKDYLGLASERLIRRLVVKYHDDKDVKDLTSEDVLEIANSVSDAVSLLKRDKELGKKINEKIQNIIK